MSSLAANAGSVHPAKPAGRELGLRIASALVLAPIAFGAIYLGTPYFDILVAGAAVLMVMEWHRMCGGASLDPAAIVSLVAVLAAIAAIHIGSDPGIAIGVLIVGCCVGMILARRGLSRIEPIWHLIGVGLVGGAVVGLVWLRNDPEIGRTLVLGLVAMVVATDIGAYFAGRTIGGPRLAPRISPGKTWAGLIGAVVLTVGTAFVWAGLAAETNSLAYIAIGTVVAIVAQIGDLLVSAVKRRFDLKDTGAIIPGHGGVLDRVDGLLLATLVTVAFIVFFGKGLF